MQIIYRLSVVSGVFLASPNSRKAEHITKAIGAMIKEITVPTPVMSAIKTQAYAYIYSKILILRPSSFLIKTEKIKGNLSIKYNANKNKAKAPTPPSPASANTL